MAVDISTSVPSSNKSTLLLLIAAFVVPVLLAKLALQQDWFNRAATNKGELMEPGLSISSVLTAQQPKWRVLYMLPAHCTQSCENALYSIKQVWTALGRKMERVEAMVVATEQSDSRALAEIATDASTQLLMVESQRLEQLFSGVSRDAIFLVDTLNNVILRYPLQHEQQQAVLKSRDILADLRRLLKLSRIG